MSTAALQQLIQELSSDEQHNLPATLQPTATADATQQPEPMLVCGKPYDGDVSFVLHLYEHTAAQLLEVSRRLQVVQTDANIIVQGSHTKK